MFYRSIVLATAFCLLSLSITPALAEVQLSAAEGAAVSRQFRLIPASGAPGGIVEVPLEITAGGNEVIAQTTVHFDNRYLAISNISGPNVNPDLSVGNGVPPGT